MNLLSHLLSPEVMRLMALTLLHFLWQGAALAAAAYAGMMVCRSASTRYIVAVAMLGIMAAAPAITFVTLLEQGSSSAPVWIEIIRRWCRKEFRWVLHTRWEIQLNRHAILCRRILCGWWRSGLSA